MTRDEVIDIIEAQVGETGEDIVLFDGLEDAFIGVAERFEDGGHRYFAVYSYKRMVKIHVKGGMTREEAIEWLEFNTVGLYAGPGTPAILMDLHD